MWFIIFLVAATSAITSPCNRACGVNEKYVNCKTICPPQNCSIAYTDYTCEKYIACEPGCDCIEDHLRDSNGVCIYKEDCFATDNTTPSPVSDNTDSPQRNPATGYASSSSSSTSSGSSSTSSSSSTSYSSSSSSSSTSSSSSSSKNSSKKKCPSSHPKCGYNEKYVRCKTVCPPQSCEISYTTYICGNDTTCTPGCDCIDNYLRNASGICILNEDCPPPTPTCGFNEKYVECQTVCPPQSCDISYTTYFCGNDTTCTPGCDCIENHLRNASGICILNDDCPPPQQTCGYNEKYVACQTICPPQSCDISYTSYLCVENTTCTPGCDCIENHLRNASGICILNDECPPPPGSGCKVPCPIDYCPTSDSRGILICDLPYPCKPGCICDNNYKLKSREDPTCIPPEQCPAVNCTRPHEFWDPCPEPCLAEYCPVSNDPPVRCNEYVRTCRPQCVCEKGYKRNEFDICIPDSECPYHQCCANETYSSCSFDCPSDFCPKVEDDFGTPVCDAPLNCPPGCNCKFNYKRVSEEDRTCILGSECKPLNCTGLNQEWNPCPSPCLRESCSDVNDQDVTCNYLVEYCEPRCTCKKGFFRNDNNECIPANQCPQKCDTNQTYADCGWLGCPNYFCPEDDSLEVYACKPPRDCAPGCMCKWNYKRRSHDDLTCILGQDCPPFECTRPNERYDSCPSACLAENCADVDNQPTICETFAPVTCEPKCVCIGGHFRNDDKMCVPAADCVKKS